MHIGPTAILRLSLFAKNHATKKHMCEHVSLERVNGLLGALFLHRGKGGTVVQMENMLHCGTIHGHSKSCLGGWRILSPSAEPAALTVAVAKVSWNAFERTEPDLVWRHKNPQVQPEASQECLA